MRLRLAIALGLAFGCRSGEPPVPAPAQEPVKVQPKRAPRAAAPAPQEQIHGRLETVGTQRVLHVWGTPHQMGFAHGYLLRDSILEVFGDYALSVIPADALTTASIVYGTVADIPEPLRREAEGIVDGMVAAGGAKVRRLGRDLTATDLLIVNAMTDLVAVGCSSLSAWGSSTLADADLQGEAVVVRNLDWSDDAALLRNQVVIAFEPDDPKRQPVLSIGFAGYIGCLSCINESGVTALFNMGYGDGAASVTQAMGGFAPSNLLLRDTIERRDVDGDGTSTAADIEAGLRAKQHAGSYIVHVVEPRALADAAKREPARILEVEADGVHTRTAGGDAKLGDNLLAATNHLRGKEGPQACSRYARLQQTAAAQGQAFDGEQLWQLGRSVRLDAVVHAMVVEPASKRVGVWLRRPGQRADDDEAPTYHEWATIFRR